MTTRIDRARALAETYAGGHSDDPYERVEEYRRYLEYTAEHPDAGAYVVAKALDMPRSRIRAWMENDSVPRPMRAIQVAEANDWLDLDWDAPTQALNCLVAWIFAGGSINSEAYAPYFAVETDTQRDVARQLLGMVLDSPVRVNDRGEGRVPEVSPGDNGTILGRYLTVLGAPTGTKNTARSDLMLPSYLDDAPEYVREEFARTYVWLRGAVRPGSPGYPVQIAEERPDVYTDAVRALLNGLVPEAVTADSNTVFSLSREAAIRLHRKPAIVEYGPVVE